MGIYIIVIAFMLLSAGVSWRLKSKFKEYSQIPLSSGLSGREVAEKMLRDNGITDVKVMSVAGRLTDHYNPADKTVNLSEYVYEARSAAAAAVAAHECGHAVQHAKAYAFLKFRSAMVPALSIASRYMQWIILIGIFMLQTTPVPLAIGVALFGLTTLFSFVTLPVEFDASKRALAWISQNGVVTRQEYGMAKDALKWAALTYVVAALGSLATLLYYASLLMGRRD
ncbi:zinc metallopeptidase [Pontibacter liquoris]|uniref:zinc metallopeptidase n=1 Tax=Pontibacter liquoris TaxID=2905677 RepID=UPI001FA7D0F0|nr:zinc metallopeptidase [Pontibacter liquoris]